MMLIESLSQVDHGEYSLFENAMLASVSLNDIWGRQDGIYSSADHAPKVVHVAEPATRYISKPETNELWALTFTEIFRRSIAGIDKRLQGRVLDAVADISESPMTLRGDTVKPLIGERKGLWRYRVGDYRLIYQPTLELRRIDLLLFSARGSAYDA